MKDHIDLAIEKIVLDHQVSEQEDLLFRLRELSIDISQATLSRRLKGLGISKQDGAYFAEKKVSFTHVLKMRVSKTGLIVLHTIPGFANGVAYTIDQWKHMDEILGTIAGDDTVLIIAESLASLPNITSEIRKVFGGNF